MYAERLTKEELEKQGIMLTLDARVFRDGKEVKLSTTGNYLTFSIYYLDENNRKIKVPIIRCDKQTKYRPVKTYTFASRTIGLHRAMWAYFIGEVPEGMVVDHKNNKLDKKLRENNTLDKLQLVTQGENLEKDRQYTQQWDVNAGGWKSRDFIIDKINYYTDLNEKAKAAHDAELSHKWRSSISQWKAKLRLFDSNPEKYTKVEKPKQVNECHERRRISKMLRDEIKIKRGAYNATRSESDRIAWKQAIENWKNYVKENYNV